MLHRWLRLGPPVWGRGDPSPDLSPLAQVTGGTWGTEVTRTSEGRLLLRLVASDDAVMEAASHALALASPHVDVKDEAPCAFGGGSEGWRFARAFPATKDHHWPLVIADGPRAVATDHTDRLLSVLQRRSLGPAEVHLQILGAPVATWEAGWLSSRYDNLLLGLQGHHETWFNGSWESIPTNVDRANLEAIQGRHAKVPVHVEVRAAWRAPREVRVLPFLNEWLSTWTLVHRGGPWRTFKEVRSNVVRRHRVESFARAVTEHDLDRWPSRKEARDVSSEEFATMVALPWRSDHSMALAAMREVAPLSVTAGPPERTPSAPRMPKGDPLEEIRKRLGRPAPPPLGPAASLPKPPTMPPGQAGGTSVPPPRVPAVATAQSAVKAPSGWVLGRHGAATLALPDDWRHVGVVGATGAGKSTLLLNLVLQAVSDPRPGSVVVLDPTGALVRDIKARLTPAQALRTVEFDPLQSIDERNGEPTAVPGFNILSVPPRDRSDVAALDRRAGVVSSDLIRSFQDAWGPESVGARSGHFFTSLANGLMQIEGANILDVRDIMLDRGVRERYLRSLPPSAEGARKFAQDELPKFRPDNLISTLDKTGWFGISSALRGALCQRDAPRSFEEFLDHRLVLLDVSRGALGNEIGKVLGSSFLTMLWAARLSRGEGAPPLTLVIDEAQTFAVASLAQMLSEGRKYGLRVVLANQYFGQLPRDLSNAMETNVNVWCCFRLGPVDAEKALAQTQAHRWRQDERLFVHLPDHTFVSNVAVHPDHGTWDALPPPPERAGQGHLVRENIRATTCAFEVLELSEGSPFALPVDLLARVLQQTLVEPVARREIATALGLPVREVALPLRRALDRGYIAVGPGGYTATTLGRLFDRAWRARRVTNSEGEEHMDLLARTALHLEEAHAAEMTFVAQGSSSSPLPDGEVEWDGEVWNVEVECSTLATKPGQVVRNLEKARQDGRGCLFVVTDLPAAHRLWALLSEKAAWAVQDPTVRVLAAAGRMVEVPSPKGAPRPDDGAAPSTPATVDPVPGAGANPERRATARDADDELRKALTAMTKEGVTKGRGERVFDALPERLRPRYTTDGRFSPTKLGNAMKRLGVTSGSEWDPGVENSVTVYHWERFAPDTPAGPGPEPAEA